MTEIRRNAAAGDIASKAADQEGVVGDCRVGPVKNRLRNSQHNGQLEQRHRPVVQRSLTEPGAGDRDAATGMTFARPLRESSSESAPVCSTIKTIGSRWRVTKRKARVVRSSIEEEDAWDVKVTPSRARPAADPLG
jgi:hypothetical protein